MATTASMIDRSVGSDGVKARDEHAIELQPREGEHRGTERRVPLPEVVDDDTDADSRSRPRAVAVTAGSWWKGTVS